VATVDGKGKRYGSPKVLPKLCNPIALWRLLNASTIRRTKASIGVPLVPCRWHDLRAPFGARQARVYQMWLEHFHTWFVQKHPDAGISAWPELIKRNAAMLGMFAKLQFACTMPCAEPDRWAEQHIGAANNFTPKNVAVIQKARELVEAGRKIVILSAVQDHSAGMAAVLNRLGVPALSIAEESGGRIVTKAPKGRADLVNEYIHGACPVLCASIQAMGLGHNLDVASAVIINGLPWDFARFDQAINRAKSPPSHGGGYKRSAFSRRRLQKIRLLTAAATKAPPSHGGGYKRSAFSRRRLQKIRLLTAAATKSTASRQGAPSTSSSPRSSATNARMTSAPAPASIRR